MSKPLAAQILAQPQHLYAVGVKHFWRKSFTQFFASAGHKLTFVPTLNDVPAGTVALLWGAPTLASASASKSTNITVLHVEDGFIRSVGLGAEFARPASWVVDANGMYFDATMQSDLECILNDISLNAEQQQRAIALIDTLTQQGISKYNLASTAQWQRPHINKPVHLVVGQVESDASITRGAHFSSKAAHSNLELVKQIRQRFPEAYIVYKPHPDVVAGARAEGSRLSHCREFVDEVLSKANITQLFSQIDALHCITSLSGFEALLRGVPVYCYGMPFYAGWGLTDDSFDAPRRQRQLSLAELVHGSLIDYPLYVNLATGQRCEVEQALAQLVTARRHAQRWHQRLAQSIQRRFKSAVRQWLNFWQGGAQ